MGSRSRIKFELSRFDRTVEIASLSLLVLLWIGVTAYYFKLPDQVPTHFNASGDADDFGNRLQIFFLPFVAVLIYAGLSWLNRYPHIYNYPTPVTYENAERLYTSAARVIRVLKLSVIIVFSGIVFMTFRISNTGQNGLGAWFLPVAVALLILPNIYFVLKTKTNR